jgi:hypothetical protein
MKPSERVEQKQADMLLEQSKKQQRIRTGSDFGVTRPRAIFTTTDLAILEELDRLESRLDKIESSIKRCEDIKQQLTGENSNSNTSEITEIE